MKESPAIHVRPSTSSRLVIPRPARFRRAAAIVAAATLAGALVIAGPAPRADAPAPKAAADGPRPRLGFLAASRDAERQAEIHMLAAPRPDRARAWLRALTEEPHVAGTPQGKKVAEYVRDRLLEMGLKAELVPYDIWLNLPASVSLKLLKPETATL